MDMTDRPTMADVADQAGVSKMTVSRVINQQTGVSEETRARVLGAIDRLGYILSQRGRSLSVGRSEVLGMLVLDVTSEWVWPLIIGVGQAAEALGYQMLLRTTGPGAVASFDTNLPPFGGDLVDGLIIVSWRVPVDFARALARRHYPVVLIDAYERPTSVNWVSADDRSGAREAALHLARLGHRRIGFIGGTEGAYLARERLAGFMEGLAKGRIARRDVVSVQGDFSRESGYEQARCLILQQPRPTAIFAANDAMALGALQAARELGVSVPGDLSLVGFDNTNLTMHVNPPLTTVARPYQKMGATAVELLIELADSAPNKRRIRQIDLPTELVIRDSTASPLQADRL
jgi:LacI family transcriptional regulator